ncbi:MAG: hypothetical protein KAK00_08865 [Nanoarchaeota archaeon]|nr:hypothetical protein [Nanoarchaeota archaeon]
MNLPKNIQNTLNKIKKDCIRLKRAKQLHGYGEGQLDLIEIIQAYL